MGDLSGESCRCVTCKNGAGSGPDLWKDIPIKEVEVLNQRVDSSNKLKLGFGSTISLRDRYSVTFALVKNAVLKNATWLLSKTSWDTSPSRDFGGFFR